MNNTPKSYGSGIPCSVYLEPDVFKIVEEKRGVVSRNSFLSNIIKNAIYE